MNYVLLLAGGVSAFALVLHVMLGRRLALQEPLSTPEDEGALKAEAWFGRHVQTIVLAVMTLVYATASREPDAQDSVFWVSLIALPAALLRLVLGVQAAAPRLDVRAWGLMGCAALLGLGGLVG